LAPSRRGAADGDDRAHGRATADARPSAAGLPRHRGAAGARAARRRRRRRPAGELGVRRRPGGARRPAGGRRDRHARRSGGAQPRRPARAAAGGRAGRRRHCARRPRADAVDAGGRAAARALRLKEPVEHAPRIVIVSATPLLADGVAAALRDTEWRVATGGADDDADAWVLVDEGVAVRGAGGATAQLSAGVSAQRLRAAIGAVLAGLSVRETPWT